MSGGPASVSTGRLAPGLSKVGGTGGASARGQATVELLGLLPVVLVLGLAAFQLLAVGYASVLAGSAAEAGALALAGGADAHAAVREALPAWSRARARVNVDDGRVAVRLRPPSLLAALEERLEVTAHAAVEDS
ncbi:MAG: pilus assembly protein [Thermoleophilaceae bacterium]|nr:pilus assembly protein [Thermoleophilaceae bacterium]